MNENADGYRRLRARLDTVQFDPAVPALVMSPLGVGWGGQVSFRMVGLKLALAMGRRCVFWGHEDPPYGQTFERMFVPAPTVAGPLPEFDLDAPVDLPVVECDYLRAERDDFPGWAAIETEAERRIAERFGITDIDQLALNGHLLAWMRPVDDIARFVARERARLGVGDTCLGVHLRRGDKQIETAYVPTTEFSHRIAAIHATWPFEAVFLASDHPQAATMLTLPPGVRLIFDDDEPRYNNANAKMLGRDPTLAPAETRTAAKNVFLLASCGGIVGQDNGNFGRLAAASIAARDVPRERIQLIEGGIAERSSRALAFGFAIRRHAREAVKFVARRLGLLR